MKNDTKPTEADIERNARDIREMGDISKELSQFAIGFRHADIINTARLVAVLELAASKLK